APGPSYTFSGTGRTGSATVGVGSPPAAAAAPAADTTIASTSADHSVMFDNVAPTVTIDQATGQADPANAGPVLFTVAFSEPVAGFDASDVRFTGSTVGGTLAAAVSGSGATYTVAVTGMTGTGTVVASIPAGAASDPAGNPSRASTGTDNAVTFDDSVPHVTIDQAPAQSDPTNAGPVLFSVVFDTPVTGFDGS